MQARHGVGAIAVTAHGATAALVDAAGGLALPVLDYEYPGPDELAADYDAARPPFAETGSPRLPAGLTLGAAALLAVPPLPGRGGARRRRS